MLPTKNILQKTFLVRQGDSTGTAFAVETHGREYLVTAKHVVPDRSAPVQIFHEEQWKTLPTTGIFHHPGLPDVAAITLDQGIAPRHPTELSAAGISLGQDVLMVGYPFGWNHTQFNINNGYPIPFVKAAILSAFISKDGITTTYLDGHSNAGFSGGPIIADRPSPSDPKLGPKIIGVVASAQLERTPHPTEINPPQTHMGGYPLTEHHVHPTNAGFILAYGISHVMEVIQAHPTGFRHNP